MRAVIISAGAGTRLLPLTRTLPKCLVPVDGRAILDHQLGALARAGVDRATLVGGYRFDRLQAHLAAAPPPIPVDLVLNPFWAVASSIGSVWAARAELDRPFLLMNGDTLFDAAILADALAGPRPGVSLLAEPLDAPEPDDMLVEVGDAVVRDVGKDLDPARATHRSLGVVLSTGGDAYPRALAEVIGGEGGAAAFHHEVVARLAQAGPVWPVEPPAHARWREIDRPEDIGAWFRTHHGDGAAR